MAETSVVPVDAQGLRGPFAATVRGRSLQCKRQAAVLPPRRLRRGGNQSHPEALQASRGLASA